jgi:hypothetical protein
MDVLDVPIVAWAAARRGETTCPRESRLHRSADRLEARAEEAPIRLRLAPAAPR